MIRPFMTMCVVAAICCGVAAPAHAGTKSKGTVTVEVKNVSDAEAFSAAVSSSGKEPKDSAFKNVPPLGTAKFKVKKGTFTLFGKTDAGTKSQEFTTTSGTTLIEADPVTGTATEVVSSPL